MPPFLVAVDTASLPAGTALSVVVAFLWTIPATSVFDVSTFLSLQTEGTAPRLPA